MHIISLKMLRDFWHRHPEAEQSLRNWHTVAENSRFADFADLRQSFGSADYVPPYTVFDVGGNNYRVVVIVRYRDGKMFVRWVMTHREYDDWCKRYRKGKV
ncbi:MAG: type II toxin-antitoxin system HigB family toxin [Candidatus Accumulibacter sp.]|jgi:mRNA interferase HigB|uniref:Type II toxin-antitoxin system HigB family toxin n=1 Tax=Candidatus Accumulibacter proximus TaxID=2954385 RepID=A0A935Q0I8_9PROT|nr:type II toxin-antitoxin system HigB family toxin [Candidatus Accumulibacter proximus]MBN8449767.1 type II toxin-antitoxin system HigB family toxin [Candidatus Accumulibacter necessarius]MBN8450304.1 type II toxin-antitoxin system HigB family toxin [Candidatus Accumulibacter necessarius]